MSMINDALRRASSAAKSSSGGTLPPQLLPSGAAPMSGSESGLSNPPSPPVLDAVAPPPIYAGLNGATAPPVMHVEPAQKKSSWSIIIIVFLVFCLAGAAAAYLWQKSRNVMVKAVEKSEDELRLAPMISERPSNVTSAAQSEVLKQTTNTSTGAGLPSRTPTVGANQGVGQALSAAVPVATSAIPAVPVKFPPLRLQSIFYRPANPSVIINNKTLFVADEISGVKVADIQAASVTLVLSGQTNILTLR